MKLHYETVSPQLILYLRKILQSNIFKDFNLVGGTQLGHRPPSLLTLNSQVNSEL